MYSGVMMNMYNIQFCERSAEHVYLILNFACVMLKHESDSDHIYTEYIIMSLMGKRDAERA